MEAKRSFDLVGKDFPGSDAGYMLARAMRSLTVAYENACRVPGARPRSVQ